MAPFGMEEKKKVKGKCKVEGGRDVWREKGKGIRSIDRNVWGGGKEGRKGEG